MLYTDDEAVIKGLRRHPRFGKLFKEEKEEPVKATASVPTTKAPEKNEVEFSTLEDAKDYFSDRYGVSRSKMRTMAAVEDIAKSHGITIKWK